MRRKDQCVQGGVRVAMGGGQNVGGPEVGDEARNLSLSGVVTALGGSMNEGGDRIVAAARSRWREPRPSPARPD